MARSNKRQDKMSEFDVAVVIAQYCTFDTIAAVAALRFAGRRVRVVLENEDDVEEILASDFGIDIRAYTNEEGSRIVKIWRWLGWDINEPRFETLRKFVYDLTTNNGAIQDKQKAGGWLKDHIRLPMSLVDFRQVWNLLMDLEDYSVRDHLMMINELGKAVELALSGVSIVQGRRLDQMTWDTLAPLFIDNPKARWYQQGMPWMRAWDKKLGGDKDAEMPEDWWVCEHPLSLYGFARQLIRSGMPVAEVREEIEALLSTMCRIAESSPSTREAWDCISRVFSFGNGALGLVVHSTDSRIPARCWFSSPRNDTIDEEALEIVKDRKEADKKMGRFAVEVIVVVDVREHVDNVAIMGQAGVQMQNLGKILQTSEPGRWDIVLKLTDDAGMVQPRVLNGGMSRQLVRTEIHEDRLVEYIQNTVTCGRPVPPPHFRKEGGKRRRNQAPREMVDHTADQRPEEMVEIFRGISGDLSEVLKERFVGSEAQEWPENHRPRGKGSRGHRR
jgi:hypothetical protein